MRIEDRCHVVCDPVQQRVRLNAAQREIDRLRAAVPECGRTGRRDAFLPRDSRMDDGPRPCSLVEPPQHRRLYAVNPVGRVPDLHPTVDAEQVVHRLILTRQVTNLGTLIDVLM